MEKRLANIFLFLLFFQISLSTHAQNEPPRLFSESFDALPLTEVLEVLRNKYDLQLAYDQSAVEGLEVTAVIKQQTLKKAIQRLFSNTPVEYQWVGEQKLMLRRKWESLTTEEPLTIKISGYIKDQTDQSPLAFATLVFDEGKKGITADENGFFEYELEAAATKGKLEMEVRYIGYENKIIPIEPNSGQAINILLTASPSEISQVTVVEKLPGVSQSRDGQINTIRMSRFGALPQLPGGLDPFRMAMLLPGVNAEDDLSAEMKVRGSDGTENLILLDGIPLYSVDHFFGVFSAVNGQMVEEMLFYKNAFPAEFGGRTASILDIRTLPVKMDKISGGLESNLLTSSARFNLPITDQMGVSIGGRLTNSNLANSSIFGQLNQEEKEDQKDKKNGPKIDLDREQQIRLAPAFSFYDLNAKWHWQLDGQTRLQASFFRGADHFEYDYERVFFNLERGHLVNNREKTLLDHQWENQGWNMRLERQWNEQFKSSLSFSASRYEQDYDSQISLTRMTRASEIKNKIRNIQFFDKDMEQIKGLHLTSRNEYFSPEGHQLAFGYQLVNSEVESFYTIDNQREARQSAEGSQHSFFGDFSPDWHSDIDLTLGLRMTFDELTNEIYQSPRISLAYQVDANLSLKGSWAYYNQFVRGIYFERRFGNATTNWVLADGGEYPVLTSRHWMTGFRLLKNKWKLDVEFYHKKTDGLAELARSTLQLDSVENNIQDFVLLVGEGETRGMDVLLEKTMGKYTGWIAYTLSKSTKSYPEIQNGQPFASQNDRRHQLKWINQYQLGQWCFSATYIFASGKPYVDLSILTSERALRADIPPDQYTRFLANYHRFDIGANYQLDWGKTNWNFGLSIFNLFNHQNVKSVQYYFAIPVSEDNNQSIRNEPLGNELQLLDFTPNLTIGFSF